MGSKGRFRQSKELPELVKSIAEARSKVEEDRIVVQTQTHDARLR
uniref:Uncharacterized protein n=1 Tax=Fagus sylvatica TaxID=28930 RepID=A0A2N9I084_FAGSY